MDTYYRVETYDHKKQATTGGFVATIDVMLLMMLNLTPLISEEELAEIISSSEDPEINKLNNLRNYLLEDMQPPEEYTSDRLNRYCLFT